LVNVSANWYSANDKWNASLHVRNLTDEEYKVAGYAFPNFLGENTYTAFYGNPRTVTLNLGYNF
jgi:iron complex outermembrane receptor protein